MYRYANQNANQNVCHRYINSKQYNLSIRDKVVSACSQALLAACSINSLIVISVRIFKFYYRFHSGTTGYLFRVRVIHIA